MLNKSFHRSNIGLFFFSSRSVGVGKGEKEEEGGEKKKKNTILKK